MSQEATHINRLNVETDIDFETIRKEGIHLLQELSGKIWTDYNSHDPGVTILEQLIYALTELIYLTDFDVKDFLTSNNGEINYSDLALYKPLEIFPSENITPIDYCKTIFDNIEGVRNVWPIKQESNKIKGLYTFLIDLQNKKIGDKIEIANEIKKYYNANRNLCEDIDCVEFLKREPLEVDATIEINNSQSPEEVMAEIFFSCFKVICPCIVYHSYRDLKDWEFSIDEILSGPEMIHGYVKENEIPPIKPQIFVSELMKEIFHIEGVESIVDFYIEKDGKKIRSEINFPNSGLAAYIKLPQKKNELRINLLRDGIACAINMAEMLRIFFSLVHGYESFYNTGQEIAELSNLPQGKYVNFSNYYSVQNHFPAIYGINQYGIPGSATPERKAQAKQLKGYLLLFEQIIANCLSQMENIKELFSINQAENVTYFTKALTDIPDIRDILTDEWKDDKALHETQLKQILVKYDNFYERKNRILDFILAMYGEKFTHKTFQQFNYYYTPEELPQVICEIKTILLKQLISINRYKARSFNYLEPTWNTENVPMIKKKVSLLLGIQNYTQTTYSDVLANYNLQFIDDIETTKCNDCVLNQKGFNIELDSDYINEHFTNITAHLDTVDTDNYEFKDILNEIVYLKDGLICKDFFRYGINLNAYKIGKLKHRKDYTVVFKHPKLDQYIYISDFKNRSRGILAIHYLQQLLVILNQESEGMHIVEHILLRQQDPGYTTGFYIVNEDNETLFTSTDDFILNEEGSLVQELSDILINSENYIVEENAEGHFILSILKGEAKILEGHQVFESSDIAISMMDKYVAYYRTLCEMEILHKRIFPFKVSSVPETFFPFRISVILPSWSARFNNVQFRDYLEESFKLNLPAHIYPEFYWLNINELNKFEKLYRNWLKLKQTADSGDMDEHSGRLIRFLLEKGQSKQKVK